MPEWRERAIELFPELRTEIADEDEIFSTYALWFELLPLVRDAHRTGSDDLLRRIYGYAAWMYEQGSDLANSVTVSFYEHLFDEGWMRPLVVHWLNPRIVSQIRPLWANRLTEREMPEVEKLLRQ
jgi:hypothetical protein